MRAIKPYRTLTNDEFSEVVTCPARHFRDQELKTCTPYMDGPVPRYFGGGRVGQVAKLIGKSGDFAIKTYAYSTPEILGDIAKISEFFKHRRPTCFVPYEFEEDGIEYQGETVPVVKMPFVPKSVVSVVAEKRATVPAPMSLVDLGQLLTGRYSNPREKLVYQTYAAAAEIERLQIYPGDVHHDNLRLTQDNDLRFIDLDGVSIAFLERGILGEISRDGYRHREQREAGATVSAFRFAMLVFFLSVLTAAGDAGAWEALFDAEHDEDLILHQSDLDDPGTSEAFDLLTCCDGEAVRAIASLLVTAASGPLDGVGPLSVVQSLIPQPIWAPVQPGNPPPSKPTFDLLYWIRRWIKKAF